MLDDEGVLPIDATEVVGCGAGDNACETDDLLDVLAVDVFAKLAARLRARSAKLLFIETEALAEFMVRYSCSVSITSAPFRLGSLELCRISPIYIVVKFPERVLNLFTLSDS